MSSKKQFEIENSKTKSTNNMQDGKKKSRIAYGFSPKQTDNIQVSDLTKKQVFVLAYETLQKLNWNIVFLSESGIIAYSKSSMSSWGEEVQIKIENDNLNIKSESTGSQIIDWGKNRKNIDLFISTFNKIKIELNELNIEDKYEELKKNFVDNENDTLSAKEKASGLFSLIIPTKGYYITPIIVILNVLIFIIMLISGVHPIMPSGESLLLWGANFRPLTIEGEWWRLITSTFIHIGIFHLLMNMYALIYIGLLLEPYLGKTRFLSAYLLTGLVGSVTSLYWNEITISAGASGAIFGMYGVFLAMLSTNLIEKTARKTLFISIGIFVLYNLANGLKGGVDNAAHLGGLISGVIIGYSFYPGLVKPKPKLKYITIGLLTIFVALFSFLVSQNITSDIAKYDKDMELFAELEQKALGVLQQPETATEQQILDEIQNNGIKNWEKSLILLENADKYDLPDVIHDRNAKLIEYCKLRIKSYNTMVKAITENTNKYDDEIKNYNSQIEKIIKELSQMNE